MSTLAEVEAAAASLSIREKEELFRFLSIKLRNERDASARQAQTNLAEFSGILRSAQDPLDWQRHLREEWE